MGRCSLTRASVLRKRSSGLGAFGRKKVRVLDFKPILKFLYLQFCSPAALGEGAFERRPRKAGVPVLTRKNP